MFNPIASVKDAILSVSSDVLEIQKVFWPAYIQSYNLQHKLMWEAYCNYMINYWNFCKESGHTINPISLVAMDVKAHIHASKRMFAEFEENLDVAMEASMQNMLDLFTSYPDEEKPWFNQQPDRGWDGGEEALQALRDAYERNPERFVYDPARSNVPDSVDDEVWE